MRAPYEYYIRFLISDGKDFEEVNDDLQIFGFMPIKEQYHQWIHDHLNLPEDFQPLVKKHVPSARAIRRIGIRELWLQDQFLYVQRAYDMLSKPLIRKAAEILALSPVTYAEMCKSIRERYGYLITESTMECFVLFFANYSLLSPVELRSHVARTKEYWKIAVTRGDADMTQFQLGMDVTVDSAKMVENLTHLGYFGAMSTRDMPQTLETARIAGEYSKVVEWGIGQREKVRDVSKELTKRLEVDYDEKDQPEVMEAEIVEEKKAPSAREQSKARAEQEAKKETTNGPA